MTRRRNQNNLHRRVFRLCRSVKFLFGRGSEQRGWFFEGSSVGRLSIVRSFVSPPNTMPFKQALVYFIQNLTSLDYLNLFNYYKRCFIRVPTSGLLRDYYLIQRLSSTAPTEFTFTTFILVQTMLDEFLGGFEKYFQTQLKGIQVHNFLSSQTPLFNIYYSFIIIKLLKIHYRYLY